MIRLGELELRTLGDGLFRLDGGAMFGVVPKALWERTHPADERNRIGLHVRCLLIQGRGRRILVDTGVGTKWTAREREIYGIDQHRGGLREELAAAGVAAEDITDVVVSHLHFDHAGGLFDPVGDRLAPRFPRARVHVQRSHWEWAQAPSEKDRASFHPDDFAGLVGDDRLVLHDGEEELCPGVEIRVGQGHTVGHQMVVVHGGGDAAVFTADTIPTAAHLKLPYIMAFDLQPMATLEEKRRILAEIADRGWMLIFDHEPAFPACRLRRDERGGFAVSEHVAL